MALRGLNAVLLDALGTLVMLEPPAPLLRDELRERFGIVISEAEARHAITAEIDYYRGHLDEGRDAISLAALRGRCAEVLRAALPQGDSVLALQNAALRSALLASLRFSAFSDAKPALQRIRAGDVRVVVVSNWDVSLADVLAELELAPLLDGTVTSASAGARKPARKIFDHALALAETDRKRAVHVGDSLEEDIIGAQRAGIEPILLSREGEPGPPGVRTITSLLELA